MKHLRPIGQFINKICSSIPEDLIILSSRVAIASVFWRSVQTKISGWEVYDQSLQFYNVSASAVMLFQYEYNLPLLSPNVAAHAASFAEFFFPIMLVLGLGTRFAALGLLSVTAVIQFLVFPEAWPTHILWFALLLYIAKHGGGRIALDRFFRTSVLKN